MISKTFISRIFIILLIEITNHIYIKHEECFVENFNHFSHALSIFSIWKSVEKALTALTS